MPFNHPVSRDTAVNLSVIAIATWLVSYAMVLAYFRHRTLKPGPATEDLREESPAVVGLLVNRFEPGPDLVEATLLDFAARATIEFREAEAGRWSVHIGREYPSGLNAFGQQVFDRLTSVTSGGVVALDRINFDDLYPAALREARDTGMGQWRFDWRTLSWLVVGAVATAVTVGGSLYWSSGLMLHLGAGVLVLLTLLGLIAAGQRMQHTPAGHEAAQHWLGVREFLRGYEASGVDEIILLLNPRSHEGTMESIEIMGNEILPEFIERDALAVKDKAKRLEPVIEKVEARRQNWDAPTFDETYAFGGLPTGRGGKFTAGEIPEAMAEINEGRVKAAQAEKEARAAKEAAG